MCLLATNRWTTITHLVSESGLSKKKMFVLSHRSKKTFCLFFNFISFICTIFHIVFVFRSLTRWANEARGQTQKTALDDPTEFRLVERGYRVCRMSQFAPCQRLWTPPLPQQVERIHRIHSVPWKKCWRSIFRHVWANTTDAKVRAPQEKVILKQQRHLNSSSHVYLKSVSAHGNVWVALLPAASVRLAWAC